MGTVDNIRGYGPVKLIAAKWNKGGQSVENGALLSDSGSAIIAPMNSRTYFGDRCVGGAYSSTEYSAFKLLGKTLTYAVSLANAGCGCNAAFYLTSMAQNLNVGECEDYYCDAHSVCGVACEEIDIQEAGSRAWYSTMHASQDGNGVGGGYGADHIEWNATEYGPGARCIDTQQIFEVSISFPEDDEGNLAAMDLRLTQAGSPCALALHMDRYVQDGIDRMPSLTRALKAGMTPVMSYWGRGDNMTWMDGLGKDGFGPCKEDDADSCGDTVTFYDIKVMPIDDIPGRWTIYRDYDIPGQGDVEIMSATDVVAVKKRVEEKGYAGFTVWNGRAFLKNSSVRLGKEHLTYVGNGSLPGPEVWFHLFRKEASAPAPTTSLSPFIASEDPYSAAAAMAPWLTLTVPPLPTIPPTVPPPTMPPTTTMTTTQTTTETATETATETTTTTVARHPIQTALRAVGPAPALEPTALKPVEALPVAIALVRPPATAPNPLLLRQPTVVGGLLPNYLRTWTSPDVVESAQHGIAITIVGASGLRDLAHLGSAYNNFVTNPFCTVEVPLQRNEEWKLTTPMRKKTLGDQVNPFWNSKFSIDRFALDDSLRFVVWDSGPVGFAASVLGFAVLAGDKIFPSGFSGDLELQTGSASDPRPTLTVKIAVRHPSVSLAKDSVAVPLA